MIGSRVYSARVPLLLAFVKHIVRRAQPRNESVFRCGDTTVIGKVSKFLLREGLREDRIKEELR